MRLRGLRYVMKLFPMYKKYNFQTQNKEKGTRWARMGIWEIWVLSEAGRGETPGVIKGRTWSEEMLGVVKGQI